MGWGLQDKNSEIAGLGLCKRGPVKQAVGLHMPCITTAGRLECVYIHKLAGIEAITMFGHTDKYKHLLDNCHKDESNDICSQWPLF